MSEADVVLAVDAPTDDDRLQAEHVASYMTNVWLPEGRCYVLRRTGVGENVLRHGDVIRDILDGVVFPPAGPLWVPSYRLAQLSEEVIAQLLARGVTDVRQIPETVVKAGTGRAAMSFDREEAA